MSTAGKKSVTEPGFKESVSSYLKGVRAEWAKITWPERRQVIVETVVVLAVVFFFVIVIYAYDKIFQFILNLFIHTKP